MARGQNGPKLSWGRFCHFDGAYLTLHPGLFETLRHASWRSRGAEPDCVEQFWTKCHETIGQCKTAKEWEAMMKPYEHLLQGSEDLEHVKEYGYEELWIEYKLWS